jgi:hypothetical protein
MPTKNLGPWKRGIDMLTEDTKMRPDSVRDAINLEIDKDGNLDRRPGLRRANAQAGLHSVWTSPTGLGTFAAYGDQLCRVRRNSNTVDLDPFYTLGSPDRVSFDELNNRVVFCNRGTLGQVEPSGVARLLGGPDANPPIAHAQASGGLFGGPALVAISYVNAFGEEGGMSTQVQVDVPDGGGIRLVMPPPPPDAVITRIYRTGKSGKLRWAADAPAAMPEYVVGAGKLKKLADTQFMRRMSGGDHVSAWNGRLLVARGRFLFWSEAMNSGLTDPRHNHATFPRRVAFIMGLSGGAFVGQRGAGVVWLGGNDPREWSYNETGSAAPEPFAAVRVTNDLFDPQLQLPSGELALWLSERGYVIGLPSGSIAEPQAHRIRLPITAAGSLAVLGRRILSVV